MLSEDKRLEKSHLLAANSFFILLAFLRQNLLEVLVLTYDLTIPFFPSLQACREFSY